SVTRTGDELSVVCRQEVVPAGTRAEDGWRCLRVAGAMSFDLVGVLAALTTPVAAAGVGVFAFSTFDTDYLLVKAERLPEAGAALPPAISALARDRHPEGRLAHADVCGWELPRAYDLSVAWDSVWHVPVGRQEMVLAKLCRGLTAGGVLVFSTGGTDAPAEKQ